MTADLVLEVGVIMKVFMNLDYVIGFFIWIRMAWFQNSIGSKIRVQSSRKRVYNCTPHEYESRMNESCKGLPVLMSHFHVVSGQVLFR